ncbi:MAG: LacI family DNA-binding transcriptional regulator [Rhodobacteraceae bacterium]|nr:LacI family DNA-binding transcriptional regulator [Paracoccaceae bacterium]
MTRPTIADVAAAARVSTATVDRVLHGRAGVSPANRQRVLQAARTLHYLPSEGDTWLPARPVKLEFFIPGGLHSFLRAVADRIVGFATRLPLVSEVRLHDLPDLAPETLVAALGRIDLATRGVGVLAIDHPRTRRAVRELAQAGIKVVTICSDLEASLRAAYVGVDDRIAGRTAGLVMGRMNAGRTGTVALFAGQRDLHGQNAREAGFRAVIEAEFPALHILPTIDARNDNAISDRQTRALLARNPDLIGLYSMGGGRSGIAAALAACAPDPRPFVIMHDLSQTTHRSLRAGVIDLVIDQNARLVGEQAVTRLLNAIASAGSFLPEHYIEPRLILRENIPK